MPSKFEKERLHKLLRLRVASYACHEKARDGITATIKNSELISARLHFHVYLCETPAIKSGSEPPHLIAPFIDHEVTRRTLSLNLMYNPSEAQGNNFLEEVNEALRNHEEERFFNMPLAYTNSTNIYDRWEQFLCLGSISESTMAKRLFENWKENGCSDGMIAIGLDRISMVLNASDTIFDNPTFIALKTKISEGPLAKTCNLQASFIIMDHIRSFCCLVAEGATPSRKGRGHILRKLLRKCIIISQSLSLPPYETVYEVANSVMNYPESALDIDLSTNIEIVRSVLKREFQLFAKQSKNGIQNISDIHSDTSLVKRKIND